MFSSHLVTSDLLQMFFHALYDEDVIKEEAFEKWRSSKDPAKQQGKGVALMSVTAFFTWLQEAPKPEQMSLCSQPINDSSPGRDCITDQTSIFFCFCFFPTFFFCFVF